MLLTLLSACGRQTERTLPAVLLPAEDIARAVSSAASDEPEGGPESLGEQMEEYAEAAYGLTAGTWEDAAVLRANGVSAYEIAVFRLAGEEEAEACEEALAAYLPAREAAFTGYAPEEAEIVSKGKACRVGNYAGLFICGDPDGAETLFTGILETGELPALPEPAPEPAAEPEPAEAPESALEPLLYELWDICRDEIDGINEADGLVYAAVYGITEDFAEKAETVYGLPADRWTDGFTLRPKSDEFPFEIAVFRMTDQETAQAYMETLMERLRSIQDYFRDLGDAEKWERTWNGHVTQDGEYLILLLCQEVEAADRALTNGIRGLWNEAEGPDQAAQIPDDTEYVEIAEGVFVTEVPWPEAEGEADPEHPGRIKYVPTGNELMEIYDTTAIVAAWEAGDPSGLTAYDRAIYDNAEAVLGDILRDGMSDFEKEVEIYDWVLRNIAYYWSHMDVMTEEDRNAYTPYGGLVDHEAVCLGYASTFQLLTELAGLESITVAGVGRGAEDHGWAMVKLNGEWYCADPTWDWSFYDAGMMDGRQWRFFNVTSGYLARTNHQWDYDAVPEAAAEDYGVPAA